MITTETPLLLKADPQFKNPLMFMPLRRGVMSTYLRVTYARGLTLRMAAEIVKALQPLDVDVAFEHSGIMANARSILSMVAMAAAQGARVYVWANGPDATKAFEIIAKAFAGGFGIKDVAD
jgi:phosphocarrier protein HPr